MVSRTRSLIFLITLIALFTLQSGCGKPFNVKRKIDLPFSASPPEARLGQTKIKAQPVWDEDVLYDTFEANLIQAGVLPINIDILNEGSNSLALNDLKFQVIDESGKRAQRLSGAKTFKRMMSYYQISTYNKYGYRRSLEDFSAYELELKGALAPGEHRSGLIFIDIRRSGGAGKLVLLIDSPGADKLGGTVRLELSRNGG